jgi:hypothetical protein
LPKFTGEGMGLTAEEHLVVFYSYVNNQNIEHEDVWTRLFVQSMDGEARKWFRDLPAGSIARKPLMNIFSNNGETRKIIYIILQNLVL